MELEPKNSVNFDLKEIILRALECGVKFSRLGRHEEELGKGTHFVRLTS